MELEEAIQIVGHGTTQSGMPYFKVRARGKSYRLTIPQFTKFILASGTVFKTQLHNSVWRICAPRGQWERVPSLKFVRICWPEEEAS